MDRDDKSLLSLLSAAVKHEENETNSGENSSNRSTVCSPVSFSLASAAVDVQSSTNAESASDNSRGQEWTPAITDISCSLIGAKQLKTVDDDCDMVNLQPRNDKSSSSQNTSRKVLNVCDIQPEHVVKCEREMRMSSQTTSSSSSSSTTSTGSGGPSAESGKPGKCEKQATVDNEHEDNDSKPDVSHVKAAEKEKTHSCQYCEKRFSHVSSLKRHERAHAGVKPHDCPFCGKQFTQRSDMKQHVRRHTGEKPHICSECDKHFAAAGELSRHKKTHSGEKPYACAYCEMRFVRRSDLLIHVQRHDGEKPYACAYCEMRFVRRRDLLIHVQRHDGEKPFACEQCGKRFTTNGELTRHETVHSAEKRYPCPLCGMRFTRRSGMKLHVRRHTGEKPYICSECDKRFTSSGERTKHKRTHSGEKPHACPYCERRFAQTCNLKEHVRRHLGEKSFACTQCENSFAGHTSLAQHVITHSGEKRYECQHCHLRFGRMSCLRRHASKHEDEKRQLCDDKMSANHPTPAHSTDLKTPPPRSGIIDPTSCSCADSVANPNLNGTCPITCSSTEMSESIHTKSPGTDTGSNRHPVQSAGKRGKQATVDNRHSENIYNKPVDSQSEAAEKEKLYSCQYCEKMYCHKDSVKRHERTHTGLKPYVCMFCENSFDRSCRLKEHVRTHTGEKPYRCLECGNYFTTKATLSGHMKIHGGERPYVCMHCEKRFVRSSNLKVHVSRHQRPARFACTHCGSRFALRTELSQHLLLHGGEKAHECHYCRKRFLHLCRLREHMTSHTEAMAQPSGESVDVDQPSTTNVQSKSGELERHWLPALKNEAEEPAAVSNSAKCDQRVDDDDGEAGLTLAIESQQPVDSIEDSKPFGQTRDNFAGRSSSDAKADCDNEATATADEVPMMSCDKCDNCPSRYSASSQQLQQHSLIADVRTAYECEKCRAMFTDYGQLLWHASNIHAQENHSRQLVTLKQEPMNHFTD